MLLSDMPVANGEERTCICTATLMSVNEVRVGWAHEFYTSPGC